MIKSAIQSTLLTTVYIIIHNTVLECTTMLNTETIQSKGQSSEQTTLLSAVKGIVESIFGSAKGNIVHNTVQSRVKSIIQVH